MNGWEGGKDIQISSRFTLAIHIFVCMDVFGGEYKVTSDFLAGSTNVNPVVIRKIPGQLKGAGLITVARGNGGAAEYLSDLVAGTDKRLVVVGGAGSLFVNPEHTLTVADGSDFPETFQPLAAAHQTALDGLRKRNDVKWTYISPAGDFQADGAYILGGEELTLNEREESVISYTDYAIALVDEIVKGNHIQQRISVVRK